MKNKSQIRKCERINLKAFEYQKKPSRKDKDNPQNRKKYLQKKKLTRNSPPKQTAHAAQYQKYIQTKKKKMGQILKWIFLLGKPTDSR